ncbi:PepSY domain-containing protein [Streptomyces sp. URMC 129]|uniref:PepSY domain-containing protein n=1 Tax=Streptomyces sp. URMC 129 TaxID=3423407 RepID=UPI003F1D4C0E
MKRKVIIAIAAVAAVVTGGTVANAALGSDDAPDDTTPVAAEIETEAGAETEAAPADAALATALADTPGVVTEIERGDGWEIEVLGDDGDWHTVRISADGTEVLTSRVENDDDDGDDDSAVETPEIDAARAIALAEEETSATIREATLDDGRWELELRDDDGREHELTIDPASGEITSREQEQEQEQNDDTADDTAEDTNDGSDDDTDD